MKTPSSNTQLSALLKDPQPPEAEGYLVKHSDLWAVSQYVSRKTGFQAIHCQPP